MSWPPMVDGVAFNVDGSVRGMIRRARLASPGTVLPVEAGALVGTDVQLMLPLVGHRDARVLFFPERPLPAFGEWATNRAGGDPHRVGERLRSIVAAVRDVVYAVSLSGEVTLLNPAFETLTGWSRSEWLGRNFRGLVHPDDVARAEEVVGRQLGGEVLPPHELRILKRDGGYLETEFMGTPVLGVDGHVIELVGSARDVTERREAERERIAALRDRQAKEEAEAANRAKDDFLAVLSHELRTPLTPVLSLATAMEDDAALPAPCREAMQLVRRNVELEARLIDDLLDLTRVIRGKLTLDCRPVDVHRLLREVLEICQDDLESKGLRTLVRLEANPATVRGDAARLEQVFWNLLKNAVKFTPEGGEVRVSTWCCTEGQRVRVRVEDTGVGISPEAREKIFAAFEQGGTAVTRKFGGLGLGLAISKGIVDAHGGRIYADSPGPGRGASFDVELDIDPEEAAPDTPGKPPPPAAEHPVRPMRILLVEDHADTAKVMRTLLRGMGHAVVLANSMASAMERVRAEAFDLMISDLGLPDGSGWDLMRNVRAIQPAMHGVALSGYGMEQDFQRSREAGFAEHVTKPVSFARLTELVRSAEKAWA